ncbi:MULTISPECIES: response regulator transcription factor [Mesorhizobium]|uniref:response regulator transcription factor n=1 Tax=Mesorhizobium TaxID=68287 RepID=UPI0007EDBE0F|nr:MULTISPECIES: response regulator transcription factor [Mesorhizobium]TPJ43688.1 response regulator transcription factor [Mesorhizobium sp. B2-6-6]ARP67315.1 two-component system response regulator [Mesorhizobium sp. WSM1497]MCA0002958.1 response regulator transcription factor [Mesorhizobium sp. B264B2A]MCA0009244.1 response regulator transcription factor [Mesorhizobium sp. B264B1B]MCA0013955.1 response regulator transcription factor [Mesorhizobium sp. B294B1A1]
MRDEAGFEPRGHDNLQQPRWPTVAADAVQADQAPEVTPMKPLILICSQDAELYLLLSHILEVDGFATEPVRSAKEVLALADEREFQAVVLDCGPASITGAPICARLKGEPRTADLTVIALIAPGAEDQHLDLLKARIDERFVRPIVPANLLDFLRARLALPKRGAHGVENGGWLTFGDLEMKVDARRIRGNGHDIHLGVIEFNVLLLMMEAPGKVFSRKELIGTAWEKNIHVEPRTVDVHVSRIRTALKKAWPGGGILTVRSAGYSLQMPDG